MLVSTKYLTHLINDYVARFKPHADKEMRFYQGLVTLEDCVNHAVLGRNSNGKRHSHQRRLAGSVLRRVSLILWNRIDDIALATSFDGLVKIVSDSAVPGFGDLAIYDTADRIGAWLGIRPSKVYLHAGTLIGARALGLRFNRSVLDKSAFPIPLQALEASDIENFLCIYKHCFTEDRMSITARPCSGAKLPDRLRYC